jgi:hypothetical protein
MKIKHIFFALMALLLILAVSGCYTPPPKAIGFPLIDIVDATVDIADNSQFVDEDVEWVRSSKTKIIGGTLGSKITAKDITIRLIDTSIQIPIKDNQDISEWFRNMPRGLTARAHAVNREAKYAAEKGAKQITVTIEGIPLQTINQPIKILVPYDVLNRAWDFVIPPNSDLRFEVYGVDIADIVVGGAVNREIDPKTFQIKIGGTVLANTIPLNTDVSSWFTNLPRGLKAVITEEALPLTAEQKQSPVIPAAQKQITSIFPVNKPVPPAAAVRQQIVTVTISGRPVNQVNEQMKVTIPAGITASNIVLTIPPRDNVRYDIGSYSVVSVDDVELRTGTNWKGVSPSWGLTGPQVFKLKDFTPAGIIQIQAVSTYKIGADGEFHWTGNSITYGNLMAEARRLNAHAIIDVVIDSDDQISETIERRHIEANHKPSELELIKMEKGIITIEKDASVNDPDAVIYVERIRETKRTWTGTALAIQYAPAYQPNVGQGSHSGYVPATPFDTPEKK